MKGGRLDFCRGDWLAILLVVVLAVSTAAFFAVRSEDGENRIVRIYQDGNLIDELPLGKDREIEIAGQYRNTVTILDGKAAITDSDCPGEDCVHSGWISGAGRSVVCLPNRVEIRIVGQSDVDFVVG